MPKKKINNEKNIDMKMSSKQIDLLEEAFNIFNTNYR